MPAASHCILLSAPHTLFSTWPPWELCKAGVRLFSLHLPVALSQEPTSHKEAWWPWGMSLGHPCSPTSPVCLYNTTSLCSWNTAALPTSGPLRSCTLCTCLPPLGPHVLAEMPHLSRKGLPNFPSFCFTVFVALSTIGNCLVICLSGFFALSFHHCTLPSASAGQAHIEAQ